MDKADALVAAERVIWAHDGQVLHVRLEAEEFGEGWLVFVHPRRPGQIFGGINLVVDKEDGSVRPVGASINPSLVIADYRRFRATTPPERLEPSSQW